MGDFDAKEAILAQPFEYLFHMDQGFDEKDVLLMRSNTVGIRLYWAYRIDVNVCPTIHFKHSG